jgi:hypothetical protein
VYALAVQHRPIRINLQAHAELLAIVRTAYGDACQNRV